MRTVVDKIANSAWLRIALCLVFGILLLVYPTMLMKGVFYTLAGYCAVMGIMSMISYFGDRDAGSSHFDFISGVLLIVLSIVLFSYSTQIANLVHIFMGIMIVLGGTNDFIRSRAIERKQPGAGMPMLIYSLVIMALGVMIVFNPFATQVLLFRIFGAVLVLLGIGEIVWTVVYKKLMQ